MIGWQRWFVFSFVVSAMLVWAWLQGMDYGRTKEAARWDQHVIELVNGHNKALEVARLEEQRRIKMIEDIRNESERQIEQARADAADAAVVAASMHNQAKRLAAKAGRCTNDTTTATRSAADRATAALLADLFQGADEAAGTMAAAYDRARAAGLACERAYDALTNARNVP